MEGDNNITRIGITGTGAGQQSSCFIGGIVPVAYTGTTLATVNGNDKLGILNNGATTAGQIVMYNTSNNITTGNITSSNSSLVVVPGANDINIGVNYVVWYAYQSNYTPTPVTGDGTEYFLGTQAGFTKAYDQNGVISGTTSGQKLTVTIPITGFYYIQMEVTGSPVAPPTALPAYPNPVPPLSPSPICIYVNGVQKWVYWGAGLDQSGYTIRVLSYATVFKFNQGDQLTFSAQATVQEGKTVYIGGAYMSGSNNVGVTYITGSLISPI
jgi:hypothetical protein